MQRVIFCTGELSLVVHIIFVFFSGKVYYDLVAARKHVGKENEVALARVEQLSPFPYDLVMEECTK